MITASDIYAQLQREFHDSVKKNAPLFQSRYGTSYIDFVKEDNIEMVGTFRSEFLKDDSYQNNLL